jgi:hypothetical protein
MPLAALCRRHSSADFTICMCEFDFRQAQGPFSLSSGPAWDYRKMWFQLWPGLPQALPYRRFEMGVSTLFMSLVCESIARRRRHSASSSAAVLRGISSI